MSEKQPQPTRVKLSLGGANLWLSLDRDLAPAENPLDAFRGIHAMLTKVLQELAALPSSTSPPSAQPTETIDAKLLEGLQWTPGQKYGREWVRIGAHPELAATIALMRRIDPNGYHAAGDYVYRIEGDFLGRYPKRKKASA